MRTTEVSIPLIAKEWGLSREVLGPSFSSALTGLMVGHLVLSPLSDRFGHPGVGFGFVNVFDVSFFPENRPGRSFFLHLPRRSLISHLGLEPESGLFKRGQMMASRLFFRLMQDAINDCDPACASAEPYMQLAIYDLLGALFATPDLPAISAHSDRLFKRICNIIKDRFADPDFSSGS